jgi:hypothetical protein
MKAEVALFKIEQSTIERQSLFDITDLERYMIETNRTRFSCFSHGALQQLPHFGPTTMIPFYPRSPAAPSFSSWRDSLTSRFPLNRCPKLLSNAAEHEL